MIEDPAHRHWPAPQLTAAQSWSRDSQPAGCRFDSYAAHQLPQVKALPNNGRNPQPW